MSRKKVSVSVMVTAEMNEKLIELAKKAGRSRSTYIRQILRRYIQYVETKDDPNAPAVDWDIDKWWHIPPPGVSEGQ